MARPGASSHERMLQLSAPLARQLSRERCGECRWYHGLWQHLRLFGLIDPTARHAGFFRQALRGIGGRAPRILVCGAADYSTYEQVLAACRKLGCEPSISVIDLCSTPLELNRWYAARAGASVAVRKVDVLAYRPARPFDAICTHALFGRFSPEQRINLLARWHALLRPGGRVVTVTPIRPGSARELVRFAEDKAHEFSTAVGKAARRYGDALGVAPDDLEKDALRYARRHRVHRVQSLALLRELFENAGFRLERLALVAPARGAGRRMRGPTTAGSAPYARIVAVRT